MSNHNGLPIWQSPQLHIPPLHNRSWPKTWQLYDQIFYFSYLYEYPSSYLPSHLILYPNRDVHSTGTSLRASIETPQFDVHLRAHTIVAQHATRETQRALAPRPKQPSNAPSHATCPSSAIWVLARSTLTHACLRHMLTNVTRVAAQPRLNATLSRTCSKPHHLAFRMSLHPPMKTPTSQCTTRLRTHANTTEQTKRRSVQQLEQDRTTQAPSQMHLSTSKHAPHPKPERQPTPLACLHRVLLRVDLGQTDRRTGPKRPDIAPIPSRRKQPRTCLKGRARPHSFLKLSTLYST